MTDETHDEQGPTPEERGRQAVPDYPAGLDERTRERLDAAFKAMMRALDEGEFARRRAIAEAAGGWHVTWAAEDAGEWVCRLNGEVLLTLAAEDFAALVSDPAPTLELTPVPLVDSETIEREVEAFAAQLDADGLPGVDELTTGRLMGVAAGRVEALPEEDRARREALAGDSLVAWARESDGRVVAYWPREGPHREVLAWMSPEAFTVIATAEKVQVFMDPAGQVGAVAEPTQAEADDVMTTVWALVSATLRGDAEGAELLTRDRSPWPVLVAMSRVATDALCALHGEVRLGDMLARWEPGKKLGENLFDDEP